MDTPNIPSSALVDRWGEPTPLEPAEVGQLSARSFRRRWWVIGAVCLALVAGVAFCRARSTVCNSLSVSCREALRAEDWKRLEDLAGRWRWWDRRTAAPLIYLAETANRRGQYAQAAELLDGLPDADPMTPPALVERSTLLFERLNRPLEGAETLERALRLDPKLVVARQRLVYFYAFTLQRRKMVQHAYEAIRLDSDLPETYVYLMAQDWLSFANAYAENTKWLRGNPDEELFLVARAVYRITTKGLDVTEDPRDAGPRDEEGLLRHQRLIAEYCERFPQNLELLVYRLERARTNGDTVEAADLLSRAPPEAAQDNRFWRYKGWLHTMRGEFTEAEASYERALSLNCYDHISRHQLAGVARRFKQMDRVKALEEVSREGWAVRHEVLPLESVDRVPSDTLRRMAKYAKDCGDYSVAGKLLLRLEEWSGEPSRMPGRPQPP